MNLGIKFQYTNCDGLHSKHSREVLEMRWRVRESHMKFDLISYLMCCHRTSVAEWRMRGKGRNWLSSVAGWKLPKPQGCLGKWWWTLHQDSSRGGGVPEQKWRGRIATDFMWQQGSLACLSHKTGAERKEVLQVTIMILVSRINNDSGCTYQTSCTWGAGGHSDLKVGVFSARVHIKSWDTQNKIAAGELCLSLLSHSLWLVSSPITPWVLQIPPHQLLNRFILFPWSCIV